MTVAKKKNPKRQQAARTVIAALGLSMVATPVREFDKHVVLAIIHADVTEKIRLETLYPDLVRAVTLYQREPGGVDVLRSEAL